jgi:hypothetical protein
VRRIFNGINHLHNSSKHIFIIQNNMKFFCIENVVCYIVLLDKKEITYNAMILLDVIVSARLPQTRAGRKTKNTIYI